jgi:hypothetical protein
MVAPFFNLASVVAITKAWRTAGFRTWFYPLQTERVGSNLSVMRPISGLLSTVFVRGGRPGAECVLHFATWCAERLLDSAAESQLLRLSNHGERF